MAIMFNVKDLSYPCIIRKRGFEASKKLVKHMSATHDTEVDLNNVEIISLSFLDELIFRTHLAGKLNSVVFRIHSKDIEEKLERISAIRSIDIKYRFDNSEIHKAVPRAITRHVPSFAESKGV